MHVVCQPPPAPQSLSISPSSLTVEMPILTDHLKRFCARVGKVKGGVIFFPMEEDGNQVDGKKIGTFILYIKAIIMNF
jgi:hypothetical protein